MTRQEITYKELFEQYRDLDETSVIDNLKIDIQDGKATEETTILIAEETTGENMYDSDGDGEYPYIPEKTFALSDSTNSFTLGFVYAK